MAIESSFRMFARIADAIGAEAALRLSAFFGGSGRCCYVPNEATAGHLLEKLLGSVAFTRLVAEYGGQAVAVPMVDLEPLRRAGQVFMMSRRGMPRAFQAAVLGLSPTRISQIKAELCREGFPGLADELDDEDDGPRPPADLSLAGQLAAVNGG